MIYDEPVWLDISKIILKYLTQKEFVKYCCINRNLYIKYASICKKMSIVENYGKNINFNIYNNTLFYLPAKLNFLFGSKEKILIYCNRKTLINKIYNYSKLNNNYDIETKTHILDFSLKQIFNDFTPDTINMLLKYQEIPTTNISSKIIVDNNCIKCNSKCLEILVHNICKKFIFPKSELKFTSIPWKSKEFVYDNA